jgi:capsular exopolysaccharide synthesis family protein
LDVGDALRAIRKSWWMVLLSVFIVGGAAVGWVLVAPRTYAANVTFFVNTTQVKGVTPLQNVQYAQQRVASYVLLISSDRLAKMVVEDTGIDEPPTEVADSISATSPVNSVLLVATVKDSSPDRTLQIATSVSTQFVEMVESIDPNVELQVTSDPRLQPSPVSPRAKLDVGLGLLGGLLLGVVAVLLREQLNTTVRSGRELRRTTGATLLATVVREASTHTAPLIVDKHGSSRLGEVFRQVRTDLQFMDMTDAPKLLSVTSSSAGEGKTTSAINIAITIADAGRSVLLIDADLRKPAVSDSLGVKGGNGLTDVLVGRIDLDEAVYPTGRDRLMVLPSGPVPPNPSELLGSTTMETVINKLRDRYDMILIDTPPLLQVTDASVVAAQSDGVILIVRYGKTKWAQLDSARDRLFAVGARLLGSILNMAPAGRRIS